MGDDGLKGGEKGGGVFGGGEELVVEFVWEDPKLLKISVWKRRSTSVTISFSTCELFVTCVARWEVAK